MNWKNIVALILTVVIALTVFCFAAKGEVSDNLEYVLETAGADYSISHKSCDKPTNDYCIFLTDGYIISTIDAYSQTQYVWTIKDPVMFYACCSALMAGQQSDCIFALNSSDFWAKTGNAKQMMNIAAYLSIQQAIDLE